MTTKYLKRLSISIGILSICTATGALGQPAIQPVFPTAADAGNALFQAVQRNSTDSITKILGGPSDLASCNDEVQDKVDRDLFVQKYQQMHRTGREADGSMTLYIGVENWPFPIPLVEEYGSWRFDPDAGQKEVLFRQIGENELTTIAMCHEFVAAEKLYRSKANHADPTETSAVSLVAKTATGSDAGDPVLSHGYYFRVLASSSANGNRPGRFTLIAYPAQYRSTGVMTFVVTDNNVVYEKDLGTNTVMLAKAMAKFQKDATWSVSDE